jgi:F0F1-type ATP synthase membrane subunit c/vacuolar-type H+-ATPase subunit K
VVGWDGVFQLERSGAFLKADAREGISQQRSEAYQVNAERLDEGVFSSDSGITIGISLFSALYESSLANGVHCARAGGVMRNPRSALILFVLLLLSLAFAVPAEDVLETTYDESETQPYEAISPFAIAVPSLAVGTTRPVLSSLQLTTGVTSLFGSARVHDAVANQSADSRVSFALLCTLRC